MSQSEDKKRSCGTLAGWAAIIGAISAIIGAFLNSIFSVIDIGPFIYKFTGIQPPLGENGCDNQLEKVMENPLIKEVDGQLFNQSSRLLSPGFEEGLFPWRNDLTTSAVVVKASALSEYGSKSGNCYLAAHAKGVTTDQNPSVYQDVGYVKSPSRLTFSVWIKNRRETSREVQLELWDSGKQIGNGGRQKVSTNWSQFTVSGNRETGGYVRVEVRWFDSNDTYLMLDDAALRWE